ncbi:hypothetical protein PIB30_072316, partial [Stylosanthes scabra]|nr:hypothetical protein [Stylosanthes scabra]
MELLNLMMKANAEKGPDALMRRFLDGLNEDVAYQVKLRYCATMEDLLSFAIKVEKQQNLLATWLSSSSISIEQLTSTSSSTPVMEEFVEYAVSGDVYVDDDPMVQQSSKGFMGCEEIEKEERIENNLREEKSGKKSDGLSEKESIQGILNKQHAQSTELLESCSLIKQDSRTNLFEEGENDTCSGGHFCHFRHKGQIDNIVMFKDQNSRRITLYRFWTSRRPRIRIKRKCIDLEHKEHGFHEVTWSASNHKKR